MLGSGGAAGIEGGVVAAGAAAAGGEVTAAVAVAVVGGEEEIRGPARVSSKGVPGRAAGTCVRASDLSVSVRACE